MYHGENFENMTQYGEFGCIFLHNDAFKIFHFLYKHNIILLAWNVLGSFCILNVPPRKFLKSGTI